MAFGQQPGVFCHTRDGLNIIFDVFRVWHTLSRNVIRQGAHIEDVEWHIGTPSLNVHYTAFTEGMANPQFVIGIGIVYAQIT